jgi:DNA-directed RNA polymerase subunit RPC12/RpoP
MHHFATGRCAWCQRIVQLAVLPRERIPAIRCPRCRRQVVVGSRWGKRLPGSLLARAKVRADKLPTNGEGTTWILA